jgi:hypothetical protein
MNTPLLLYPLVEVPTAARIRLRPLVLLCHKFSFTSQQHGHRRSLRIMARAMSSRSVEIESGTWRCTRPAAARDVTFG